jgi:predicted chitinase
MRAQEFLIELFDSGKSYQWVTRDTDKDIARFVVGGVPYTFTAEADGNPENGHWVVDFKDDTGTDEHSRFGLTGRGNSVRVMSIVTDIMREFISKHGNNIRFLAFQADEDEPSRLSLYLRIAKRLLPNWIPDGNSKIYWLYNPEYDERRNNLEEGWKDWVAGGAMALGALGAHGDATAATKHQINKPAISQQAKAPAKQAVKPGKLAHRVQQVAVPKKITPEESRGGQTPEQLKAYIQACAERYLPAEEVARFMGEVAHETANFTSMVEKNPEKNIKHYGKRGNPLGNKDMNDAWRYIGRGYLQITGKYNYKHFGDKIRPGLGDELLANPDMAMRKDVAAALAVVYWRERVAPKMQAGANSKEIAKAINGRKPKGLKSREEKTKQVAAAMNKQKSVI